MAMIKPIALSKNAFDATQDQIFYFTSTGGNQVVKNKITIRLQSDNSIVYTNTVISYKFNQTIPANTLTNGVYYNYYFNTYDINDNVSDNSNVIPFYCYTTPSVSFTNLSNNGVVNASRFQTIIQYSQNESELLDFLIVNFYTSSNQLISTSKNLYSTATPPLTINYILEGLENNTSYYVQAVATTVNGTVVYSSLIKFRVVYEQPVLYSQLELENKCNDGYMQIDSNIILIDGVCNRSPVPYSYKNTKVFPVGYDEDNYIKWETSYSTSDDVISLWTEDSYNYSYLDISLSSSYVSWNQGFSVPSDFAVTIYGHPTSICKFLQIYGYNINSRCEANFVREIPYGETTVKDYFELKCYIDGVLKVYQRSNYVDIMNVDDYIMIFIKKNGNTYTLTLTIITSGNTNTITWNTASNVKYNGLTDFSWGNETYLQGTQPTLLAYNIDSIFPLTNVYLYGGIYDDIDITSNMSYIPTTSIPVWNYKTILNCTFNATINAGNVDIMLDQLTKIKIKRKKVSETSWITIYEKDIVTVQDLAIDIQDSFIPSNSSFQYAIVPILTGNIEGDYITKTIANILRGTFLSNDTTIFKLYNSVLLGTGVQNISVGTLQPIGKSYPIVIQNGTINYYSNTITATLCGYNFENTRTIDRQDVTTQVNDILSFLTNGNAFCITDWNGNIWIAKCNGAPSITYNTSYGNGVAYLTFSFVEQGKYNNQSDMYNNGLIEIES